MDTRHLDRLESDLGNWFGLDRRCVAKLVQELAGLILGGGQAANNFIGSFEAVGLSPLLHSRPRKRAGESVTPDQVIQLLGSPSVTRIAKELGVRSPIAAAAIGTALPRLIDELSSDGTLPTKAPDELTRWLELRAGEGQRFRREGSLVGEWAAWLMAGLLLTTTLLVIRGSR